MRNREVASEKATMMALVATMAFAWSGVVLLVMKVVHWLVA